MANIRKDNITCPQCGKQSTFDFWDIINTAEHPEMRAQVRSGAAFTFTCPDCGKQTKVFYNTLYHQPEDKLMVYFAPENKEEAIAQFQKTAPRDEAGNISDGYRLRVVESLNALIEKLAIEDAKLNDMGVEILKLFAIAGMHESNPEAKIMEMRFARDKKGEFGFWILLQGGKTASMNFHHELYAKTLEQFADAFAAAKSEMVIDMKWAMEQIRTAEAGA